MDWNRKLLVFVCVPMFVFAGISFWASTWSKEYSKASAPIHEAAKPIEDSDYYGPEYYEQDWIGPAASIEEWGDAGYGDPPYRYPAFHRGDDLDGDYIDLDCDEPDLDFDATTQVYVESPPPDKDDQLPWLTIMTAGIGGLTGLISAISSLLKSIATLRRREDEDEDDGE